MLWGWEGLGSCKEVSEEYIESLKELSNRKG
jgi:hypothetical protein